MADSITRRHSALQLTITDLTSGVYTVKFHSGLKTVISFAVLGGTALAGAVWLGWKLGELTALL